MAYNDTLTRGSMKLLQPTRRKKYVNLSNYTIRTNTTKPVVKIPLN